TLVTFGPLVAKAQALAASLSDEGISIQVINARFIKPMDETMLHTIFASKQPIMTLEEGSKIGGFGSGICEFAAEHEYKNNIHVFGITDHYHPQGDTTSLLAESGMSDEIIIAKIKEMVK
ncbi:MAG: transketolase C-terminal domain-containing protein, partial [Culicoidibacterales bacterium]